MPIVVIKILIALGLDQWLGEPKRFHPLVGFGRMAHGLEARLNQAGGQESSPHNRPARQKLKGALAWSTAVIPAALLVGVLSQSMAGSLAAVIIDCSVLYLCIGRRSLREHADRVRNALSAGNLEQARHYTGMMVSRDCAQLDPAGCARATIESVLENGNDSVYGTLFWFALLGSGGAVLYRLANTLDAMWGYRNRRFLHFGWAAARLDDLLNYPSARLCALSYALAGRRDLALSCWRQQAQQLSSPNGGPVMCAGAGALNLQLGGPTSYHGQMVQKPFFGGTDTPGPQHITQASQLLDRGLILFVAGLWLLLMTLPAGWNGWNP